MGYHACVYYAGFARPPGTAHFSTDWGLVDAPYSSSTEGDWQRFRYEEVVDELLRRAGKPDLDELVRVAKDARELFESCKVELLVTLDAALADGDQAALKGLRAEAAGLQSFLPEKSILTMKAPQRVASSDHDALFEGIRWPPHEAVLAKAQSLASHGTALRNLEKVTRQARLFAEKRRGMQTKKEARTSGRVFIGHGRSPVWKDLRDLLRDRLRLAPDEFNLEPAAGKTTTERIAEMLEAAVFAFLVMTAEDEHADNTKHARENVIHEAGLFQGRLGFHRAIILLEDGCSEFSNITGLVQIRFPKGNVVAASEEIRRVLEREGLLPGA